jgi:hypothetical protein
MGSLLQQRRASGGIRRLFEAIVPVVIFGLLSAMVGDAQQVSPLSKEAAAIKVTVEKLAPGAKITVFRRNATVEAGSLVSSAEDEFVLYDTDVKANVHVKYEDVSSVKNGWSAAQQNSSHLGRHVLVAGLILGTLFGILFWALATDKS